MKAFGHLNGKIHCGQNFSLKITWLHVTPYPTYFGCIIWPVRRHGKCYRRNNYSLVNFLYFHHAVRLWCLVSIDLICNTDKSFNLRVHNLFAIDGSITFIFLNYYGLQWVKIFLFFCTVSVLLPYVLCGRLSTISSNSRQRVIINARPP